MFIKKSISSMVIIGFLLTLLYGCGGDSSEDEGLTENISQERQSNHIKALFFGTGPYAFSGSPGCVGSRGRWVSFPAGSLVEVVVPAETTDEDYQFIVEEMDKINTAVAGYYTTLVVRSGKSDLTKPKENQLTFNFVDRDGMKKHCGNADSGGCIEMNFHKGGNYLVENGKSFYPADKGIFDIHEIGHGIGLCHVNQQVFPEGTMASQGSENGVIRSFSESELAAINYVFTSGIAVGSTEQEFWDAGLIP